MRMKVFALTLKLVKAERDCTQMQHAGFKPIELCLQFLMKSTEVHRHHVGAVTRHNSSSLTRS